MVTFLKEPVPKYRQLSDILRKEILKGTFRGGDRFYSERQLMKKFSVSQNTVIEGLRILENEGLIRRIQGKGKTQQNLWSAPLRCLQQEKGCFPDVHQSGNRINRQAADGTRKKA